MQQPKESSSLGITLFREETQTSTEFLDVSRTPPLLGIRLDGTHKLNTPRIVTASRLEVQ